MMNPLTRIQKLIGERMTTSKLSKPCFYIESKADVTELMALRPKLGKSLGVRITSNAFLIRALALATQEHPAMLGLFSEGRLTPESRGTGHEPKIKIADAVNVGFPVHAPQGLVVPVIKNANKKTLAEIAQLEKLLIEKARSNKLALEDMEDQTIGLSNLGVYGIESFFAIPFPVTSTILAVGNVIRKVIPHNGQIAGMAGAITVRKMMSLSLAVDRVVTNEIYAAKFLNLIIDRLQNPKQLI
jgi:pyruvate dehydrogenase E2 component (dihydrolipoamide acetyltransferase)